MAEPDNLVLEHLRAIRSELAKMGEWMHTMSVETTAIRRNLGVVISRGYVTRPNEEQVG
jgi:hypothetical protein